MHCGRRKKMLTGVGGGGGGQLVQQGKELESTKMNTKDSGKYGDTNLVIFSIVIKLSRIHC